MNVIDHLATTLNQRDEIPNQELAKQIVKTSDKKAVGELVKLLNDQNRNIQNDCIKVLYEIGERNPRLISGYSKEFLALLESKNNRMVWGAMMALDTIVLENPEAIYHALSKIIDVADHGSVITRDHAVGILVKLTGIREYSENTFALLLEELRKCPTNQLPMYAEKSVPIINGMNKEHFIKTLAARLEEVEKESQRKRIEKVIKKFSK